MELVLKVCKAVFDVARCIKGLQIALDAELWDVGVVVGLFRRLLHEEADSMDIFFESFDCFA